MNKDSFIEIDFYQGCKEGQLVSGDVFMSQRIQEEDRFVCVLSDGLGSGVKAGVLSTLTATMASKFVAERIDIHKTARIIMNTLPVCKERKISYATFSIVDITGEGDVRVIEYDNPPFIVMRGPQILHISKETLGVNPNRFSSSQINFCNFKVQKGDRIILFSDGVNQSGMGTAKMPLGWGLERVADYAAGLVKSQTDISAREMAKALVFMARANDQYACKDDITAGVIYVRDPRDVLLLSGPSIHKEKDPVMARMVETFTGKKVICGGTTATIVARELKRQIQVELGNLDPTVPPPSKMHGVDLVTEGILTLGRVGEILESGENPEAMEKNAAVSLAALLLNSDRIKCVCGTKINEVHQDPTMPVELEIRRNIMKKIQRLLETKYLKKVSIEYI